MGKRETSDDLRDLPTDLARSRADLSHPYVLAMWDSGSASRPVRAGESLMIGRAANADVLIDHPTVSRRHAILTVGTPSRIEDLGSANGIRVGDVVLREKGMVLAPGQAVQVGAALLVLHGSLQADGPPVRRRASPTGDVVVEAEVTRRIHETIALVAKSTLPVLIQGETGVGKDILAETIHRRSPRARKPFVRLNCASVPSGLLESELFGYDRGAFTGAAQAKTGLLESADGGTMFLDEIAEMEPTMQAKLLHVLERGEVLRVGSLRPRPVDVRFVAATNRDIEALVASGGFRQDLYFRLKGMSVVVPPLAERVSEIEPLAVLFLGRACAKLNRAPLAIAPDALVCLKRYNWPGNVRELRHAMDRAAVLCTGGAAIDVGDLPPECVDSGSPRKAVQGAASQEEASSGTRLAPRYDGIRRRGRPFEREQIIAALESCSGNQSAAARMLGISRRTLVARLADHKIPRPIKDNRS